MTEDTAELVSLAQEEKHKAPSKQECFPKPLKRDANGNECLLNMQVKDNYVTGIYSSGLLCSCSYI